MDEHCKGFRMVMDALKGTYILASGSPRRRELLAGLGVDFTVDTPHDVDESHGPETPALDVAPMLALRKLRAYKEQRRPAADVTVISADTVVIIDNRVLGKPASADDAREMLRLLSGRTHLVVTGMAVGRGDVEHCDRQVTEVTFARLSDEEIDHYVTCYRPFDKAGAYGIQEWIGYIGISSINGDYYNVMGLPVRVVYNILKSLED